MYAQFHNAFTARFAAAVCALMLSAVTIQATVSNPATPSAVAAAQGEMA